MVRNRRVFSDDPGVTVCCPKCRRRLGRFVATEYGIDGVELVTWERAMHRDGVLEGAPMQDRNEWYRVQCRCGFDWRGRESDLTAVVSQASTLGVDRTALPV